MKKIAIVITRMVPGGASTVVKQLIDGAKEKYCFTLYTGEEDIDDNEKKQLGKEYNTIFVHPLVRNISFFSDLTAFWRLFREFYRNRFDIVHTHTSKAGILGRYAAALAGIKNIIHTQHGTIYQPHGNIPGVPDWGFRKSCFFVAERLAGFKTKYLTVLSKNEYGISLRLKLCTPARTIIIPNGVDTEKFKSAPVEKLRSRKLLGIEEDECYILSIGRMTAEKGHYILVDAFRKLFQSTKLNVKLGIVGEGPSRNEIENENGDLIKSGKLVLYGQDMEIRKYLWAADIFVLPSLYEGFGIAILEAMAVGLPVIASDVGGIPDLVENNVNGYLVEPGNSAKLCNCIDKLALSSDTRDRMGHENILKAGLFTLKKMQKKYYDLYDK